jgi:hypothetical protein
LTSGGFDPVWAGIFCCVFFAQDEALDASRGPASASFAGAAIHARVELVLLKEVIFAEGIL